LILGIGGGLALSAVPFDTSLTEKATMSESLDVAFEAGASLGSSWTQVGGALGTLIVGRATGHHRLQRIGADLTRAQILTEIVTTGLKVSVNRTRPDGARFSFPSGHASSSFATATVLQHHLGTKVGVPAYAIAAYIGASRVQDNRHYASDVIFGAAVGIASGRTVTLELGTNRFAVSPAALPGGLAINFVRLVR
jgi:membrane-associated phospholipid phosphatase